MTTQPVDLVPQDPALGRRLRIGWLVGSIKVQSASIRYRCFHMARVLAQSGIENAYFTDPGKMAAEIGTLDAVIIIKRLDAGVLRIAAAARRAACPVFLDLCDDLLSERYAKNLDGLNGLHFAALAPNLAAITVPSAAMAERIRQHMTALDTAPAVHVIPDIAETRTLYHLTEHFVTGAPAPAPPPLPPKAASEHQQVLWFGNFGAPHSNFGIFSLLPALPALRAVHRDIPLELVVVSNNKPLFDSLTADCGFPVRYVPWAPHAVYDALDTADVALLTGGTDEFCSVKSSNRTLQALIAGVPVITDASPALSEFTEAVLIGKYEANLRRCLGADPATRRRAFVAPAMPILERYSAHALTGLWRNLLGQHCGPAKGSEAEPGTRPEPGSDRALILVEDGARPDRLRAVLRLAKTARLTADILMSTDQATHQAIREVLLETGHIPRLFEEPQKLTANMLRGAGVMYLCGPEGAAAAQLRPWAEPRGIPILHSDTAPPGAAAPARPPAPAPSHRDRPNKDGSSDWVFVVHQNARGWILDAICREIGSRQPGSWQVAYNPPRLPQGQTYFFSHFSLYQKYLRKFPDQVGGGRSLIWYTHPRDETRAGIAALLADFDQARQVIFTCAANRDVWLARGLDPARATVVLGGADADLFRGHARGRGVIGLSSSFYERKNPDVLRQLVQLLPHRRFDLVGRNWEQYALFGDLLAAPNFSYQSAAYDDYPAIYARFDVFLSMSRLEGGPIPLLEAMMANAVPVASDTGFAPDLIRHGENGFLFDVDAPAEQIAGLIEQAWAHEGDIRGSVLDYDWDAFARRIVELAE